jgi:hypothetical protein
VMWVLGGGSPLDAAHCGPNAEIGLVNRFARE